MGKSALPLGIVGATLSIIALGDLPYGYYTFLRIAITTIAILLSVAAVKTGDKGWLWVLVPIGIVWNPLIPVFLSRETWAGLNLLAALMLVLAGAYLSKAARTTSSRAT